MLFLMRRRGFANGSREPARLMHLHENPKSKTIAFREELTREHCISSRPQPTRRAPELTGLCAARSGGCQHDVLFIFAHIEHIK
jgi:hypothetical protein